MRTSFLTKLLVAYTSDLPFKTIWNRMCCADDGHELDTSILLDKLPSENHPHTDREMVFTVNIRYCKKCDMIFMDNGVEYRIGHKPKPPNEHQTFLTYDSAPSLRAILKMIDSGAPMTVVNQEVRALLIRTNRSI